MHEKKVWNMLTIKTPEQHHWRSFFIVNFEHISNLFLGFLLLTLNKQMLAGLVYQQYWTPPDAYSELFKTSKVELFAEIVSGFQRLTVFAKSPILDIWHGFWARRWPRGNPNAFLLLLLSLFSYFSWLSIIEDEQKLYNDYINCIKLLIIFQFIFQFVSIFSESKWMVDIVVVNAYKCYYFNISLNSRNLKFLRK